MKGLPAAKVLVVDDRADNLVTIDRALRSLPIELFKAQSAQEALTLTLKHDFCLALLDVQMPEVDGFELAEIMRNDPDTAKIPLIFITAVYNDEVFRFRGYETGAVDYLTKPLNSHMLRSKVGVFVELYKSRQRLRLRNDWLDQQVRARTAEVERSRDATVEMMGVLAETRDNETGAHIRRTQHYVRLLADAVAGVLALDDQWIDSLYKTAPLHDIGKIGIPDSILLKPGRFTPEEFEEMQRHTVIGSEALEATMRRTGEDGFLAMAARIARSHHEKWDGSGYPDGLVQEAIPLEARIMAVADVYDALRSERCYKAAFSHAKAKSIMIEGAGSHFDPLLIDTFLMCEDNFEEIAERWRDPESPQ